MSASGDQSLRRYVRWQTRQLVRVRVGEEAEIRMYWTSDISRRGVFVEMTHPPQLGSCVTIEFASLEGTGRFAAKVAHVIDRERAAAMGREPGVGLEIEGSSAEAVLSFMVWSSIGTRSVLPASQRAAIAEGILTRSKTCDPHRVLEVGRDVSPAKIRERVALIERIFADADMTPTQPPLRAAMRSVVSAARVLHG